MQPVAAHAPGAALRVGNISEVTGTRYGDEYYSLFVEVNRPAA